MKSHRRIALTATAFAAAIFAAACEKQEAAPDTTNAAVVPTPSTAQPKAQFVTPMEGDSVTGPDVPVTMSVEGVRLVPVGATPTRVEGEGHLHILIDRDPTPGGAAIPQDSNIVHLGTGVSETTLKGLKKGPHRLILVFAYGDHVADEKVATDTLNIVVR